MKVQFFSIVFVAIIFGMFPRGVFAQTSSTPSILFSPEQAASASDQTFTTNLLLDTAGQPVGGVGAKIKFDPQYVVVEKIETHPVFPDYPSQSFDNTQGTAVISGIVRSKEELYTGSDKFATITWRTKAVGETKIELLYEPNSTKDSNIAVLQGSGDILQKVNTVQVTITGGPARGANGTPIEPGSVKPEPTLAQKLFPKLAFLWAASMFFSQIYLLWKIHHLEKAIKGRLHENPHISV